MLLFFSLVLLLGPPPSQILRSHTNIVPRVQYFCSSLLLLGPPPSQILTSHTHRVPRVQVLLFYSPVIVLGPPAFQFNCVDQIVPRVQYLCSSHHLLGPPPSQIRRSPSYIMPRVQCFPFSVVALGPPPSQIVRSHSSTSMLFSFFILTLFGPTCRSNSQIT